MKIGLDFDGVISNCGKLKSNGAKKLYNIDIPPAEFKKELVIGNGLLTTEQYRELQKNIYETRETGFLMELIEGVLTYLPKLHAERHTILIVTSRSGQALKIAKEWSEYQGLELYFVGVGYGNSKADALQYFDVYIDDDINKLEPLIGIVPNLFLFSWEYNKSIIKNDGVIRKVASWKEFYDTISTLKGVR